MLIVQANCLYQLEALRKSVEQQDRDVVESNMRQLRKNLERIGKARSAGRINTSKIVTGEQTPCWLPVRITAEKDYHVQLDVTALKSIANKMLA